MNPTPYRRPRRTGLVAGLAAAVALLVAGLGAAPASAAFGLSDYDVTFTPAEGQDPMQAGSHPFAMTTSFRVNSNELPDGALRNLVARQVAGLVADTTAYPRCTTVQFLDGVGQDTQCADETAVGVTANLLVLAGGTEESADWIKAAVFNLTPPPGALLRLGFKTADFPVTIDVGIEQRPPYEGVARLRNVSQVASVFASVFQLWGDPSDPAHNGFRGDCYSGAEDQVPGEEFEFEPSPSCTSTSVAPNNKPFLTLPTSCTGPALSSYEALAWDGATDSGGALTHDEFGNPQGFVGCDKLELEPTIDATPTTRAAQSASGLDFRLSVENNDGLTSVTGLAQSAIKRAEVTLPEGMTVNPSQAEGLEACSEVDLDRETISSAPGQGCPEASKIGTIEVESPLLGEQVLKGSLFVAEPYANTADDSLIALYVVIRDANLGILIKQPIKVEPDPRTGRLVSTSANMPQLPFSHFRLHFREGGRAPLISPPGCGSFETEAKLYPWSGGPVATSTSTFEIISGPNSSPCPSGPAPFDPEFEAGTNNNAAGEYSPFYMRMTRRDGQQDLTRFSSVLPPGVLGKIAGVPYCPEAGIAQAQGRTGRNGAQEELDDPSCPAASRIGRTAAGAGVGSQLTFVAGSLYLSGPYNGAPLSVVSITPAKAGPFDAGTVVVRVALDLNPVTAEVEVDGAASDPIPHILKGIPLNVRDLRVYVDRPDFTLNATSCEEEQTEATLFGGGTVLAPTADIPVGRAARYQAADCASLGFKPRLGIKLNGGTRRGANPGLTAVLRPRPGDANIERTVVRLPRSSFLDQAHIRTICTRVQFAADNCPKGAIYGRVVAFSPLLDQPLQGPAYLRSSNNELPDLVFDLRGIVDIESAARIDSIRGGIRATFPAIPDAPLTKVVVRMQGGRKGLIVNSRNLCGGKNRADLRFGGHNGRSFKTRSLVRPVACKTQNRRGKKAR